MNHRLYNYEVILICIYKFCKGSGNKVFTQQNIRDNYPCEVKYVSENNKDALCKIFAYLRNKGHIMYIPKCNRTFHVLNIEKTCKHFANFVDQIEHNACYLQIMYYNIAKYVCEQK